MNEQSSDGTDQIKEWKIAVITLQSPGPRYVIRLDSGVREAVDNVRFNGFDVGLDGRAEVEYKRLEITKDDDFTHTAQFYDHSVDTENNQ